MAGYRERELTPDETRLANAIRYTVPRDVRLEMCQRVCQVIEDLRDRACGAVLRDAFDTPEQYRAARKDIWDALHFPRYRFFAVALPEGVWEQFAEVVDEASRV